MEDWDWGSSDIGSGSGGFSSGDYYWTGGKFTDWSGKSMGKFDWNSGSGYSSPIGDGGYGYGTKLDKKIKKEIESGLPHMPSLGMPVFISKIKMAFIVMLWLCSMAFLTYSMFHYLNDYGKPGFGLVIISFFCAIILFFTFVLKSKRWYPEPHHVTKRKIRQFYGHIRFIYHSFFLCQFVLSLLPLCVYLYIHFSGVQITHEHSEWYIVPFIHRDPSIDLNIALIIVLCIYFIFMTFLGYILILDRKHLNTEKFIDSCYVYLKNKAGELDDNIQGRLKRKAEVVEQIRQKNLEILKLQEEIREIDNQVSKLT